MFDRLIVRPQAPLNPEAPLDLGALVEAALFYGELEVVVSPQSIKQIALRWSAEGLLELLNSGVISFKYQQNTSGIRTDNAGTDRERHAPVLIELASSGTSAPGPEVMIGRVLREVTGKSGRARRLTPEVTCIVESVWLWC